MKGLEYRGLTRVEGPIIILQRTEDVGLGEMVIVYDRERNERKGRIIEPNPAPAMTNARAIPKRFWNQVEMARE